MHATQLLWLAALSGVLLPAIPARSQEQHSAHPSTLPIIANGATDPASIPDHLAYAHFLIAIAEPDAPTATQVARRRSLLAPIGLAAEDEASLITALNGLRAKLDFNAAQTHQLSAEPERWRDRLIDLRLARSRMLEDARAHVAGSLGTDGVARLKTYIQNQVKRNIVIYGDGVAGR